ncbi:MAG: ABC transporter permease [Sulfitobacter sp.]
MSLEILKPYFPWITLISLVLIVGAINPDFFNLGSMVTLVADIVPLFIMALGMTFAIYIGGIDLSVQQVANLVTVVATAYLAQFGIGVALMCMLCGFVIGGVSGWITTKQFVPSFVSTLATGFIALSGARYLSGERALSMNAEARDASFGWMFGNTGGVPHELVIAGILLAIAWFLQTRTTFGRALKAVGAGELAAVSSGLNVNKIKILAFALSGLFAAIAGLMFSVKLSGGDANLANGFLILAIVAVLVGGTPLTGGVGGMMNTLVGTLIVVVIRSAMVYLQVDATMQQMVFGVILIVAIALTIDRTKMGTVK